MFHFKQLKCLLSTLYSTFTWNINGTLVEQFGTFSIDSTILRGQKKAPTSCAGAL